MSTSPTSSANSVASLAASLAAPQTSTTGSSTFASDLQASVTRALEIASLPMQALQADQSTISGKTSELSTLGGLFNSLQTALQAISSGTGSSALQATVGDQSVLSASVTGSALPGTYTVDVLDSGFAFQRDEQLCHAGSRIPPAKTSAPAAHSLSQSARPPTPLRPPANI